MESTAVVFFLEKSQYFLPGRTLFRQGATAPKSWQVPPVITGGVGEDTHIKSYYSRRKTKKCPIKVEMDYRDLICVRN